MAPRAGDPFSRHRQRGGAPSTMEQALGSLGGGGRRQQQPAPGAGYGLVAPPACPPSSPQQSLKECLRAGQQMLEDTIQLEERVPWTDPPFHARWVPDFAQIVLGPTAALNAVGNAAAAALVAANTLAGPPAFAPTLVTFAAAGQFVDLFTITAPQGHMIRISSWGIDSGNLAPRFLATGIRASTVGGTPTPPNPFLGSAESLEQEPTFILLYPGQEVTIRGTLRDTNTAALLGIGVHFWIWPVNKRVDSKKGAILRSGYGADCDS